jgi:S1-C subfamily serine protease
VLFYFTGLHSDYHKPTDDANKINYMGQLQVVKHIYSLVEVQSRNGGKVVFTPTKEMQMNTAATFKVTLGIMPDYSFSGNGVRVDGVTEGRPAEKAGLKAGDVIIKLGDHTIGSMESYMEALSKFNKGDKTTVYFNRGSENHSSPVEF